MATSGDVVSSRPRASERRARADADASWERAQEKAIQALKDGDAEEARLNWAKALDVAERCFERGDPRLATSLASQGFVLLRQDQIHKANTYFQLAIAAWEDAWRWVPMMTPGSPASDEDEAEPYDQAMQDAFYALIEQGKAMTEALMRDHRLPEASGDDWLTVKPKAMNDIRRLFAAVFLMPTAQR
jgi:tetratricopeptide (TPR) repeat protein